MSWVHPDLQRCLCWDSTNNDWCDGYWDQCENYWRSTYGAGAAGVVAATVLMIFVAVYYMMRILSCLRCVTCCLVRKRGTDRGVSRETVRVYRKWMSATMLGMGICAAICISYRAGDIYSGMKDINNSFTTFRESVIKSTTTYRESSVEVANMLGLQEVASEVVRQADTIHSWTDSMDDVQSYVINSAWVLDLLVAIPLGFMVLVLVLSMLRVHRVVPEIGVFVVIFFAVAVYMIQVTFGVGSVVTPDVCDDYSKVTNVASQIMKSQLKCDDSSDAPMGGVFRTSREIVARYVETTCPAACDGVLFSCGSAWCDSLSSVFEVINNSSKLVDESARGTCVGSCSISQCAEKCLENSPARMLASDLVARLGTVMVWDAAMVTEVVPLASCEMFIGQIVVQQVNVCGDFKSKLTPYAVATGFMCFLATLMVVSFGLLNCIYEKEDPYVKIGNCKEEQQLPEAAVGIPIMAAAPPVATYGAADTTKSNETAYPTPPAPFTVVNDEAAADFTFDPVDKPAQ